MKKILLFVLLCAISETVSAQWSGGLKGGVNLSSQKWEVSVMGQSDSKKYNDVGYHIGGYLNYKISDVMSLQPEFLYNALKFDIEGTNTTLNYLSIPVMFGYGVEGNKLIFQVGPQFGVLLSSDPKEFKDQDYYKSIDFSLCFGAQVNLGKFNLAARFALGLSNITSDKLDNELEASLGVPVDLTIKNSNTQFSVGYKLFGE